MGYSKDREIEEMEQGWNYSGQSICDRCLADDYLRSMVKEQANRSECSFCGRVNSKRPIAISFNRLMKVIAGAVYEYYDHVENEAIAYVPEDGGYIGDTYDTYDLIHDEIPTPSERADVLEEIADCLGDYLWCEKQPYAITGSEQYTLSWERFCETVKYETRFFFGSGEVDPASDIIPVPVMLSELGQIIQSAGLITELPVGTKLFRIRVHKTEEVCDSWSSLGSPPPEFAVSNRMSAAGISMFYAAFDPATAKAETTANLDPAERNRLTVATWMNTHVLNVLDLSRLPERPNFYAQMRYDRDQLIFLEDFVTNITQPVSHDGREHIDYVPTQILTEYFRHSFKVMGDVCLDGIIYPSARRKHGRSLVIYAAHKDLDPRTDPWRAPQTPVLQLDSDSIRRMRRV